MFTQKQNLQLRLWPLYLRLVIALMVMVNVHYVSDVIN